MISRAGTSMRERKHDKTRLQNILRFCVSCNELNELEKRTEGLMQINSTMD